METSEILKLVEQFAKQFELVIGSIGFSDKGELEKVYLFKSRTQRPAFHTQPMTEAKPLQ